MPGFGNKGVKKWFLEEGEAFVRHLGVKEGSRVLDIGCGFGSIAVPAAHVAGKAGRVTAVDVKQAQLDAVRKRVAGTPFEDCLDLVRTDGSPAFPSVKDDTVDSVFVFDVLQHIDDWKALFAECRRVLAPDGRLHVNPSEVSHPGRVDMDKLQHVLNGLNLEQVRSEKVRLMHYKHMAEDIVRTFCLK